MKKILKNIQKNACIFRQSVLELDL